MGSWQMDVKGRRRIHSAGMAIRLARHYRIPVLNLSGMDVREAMDRLDRIAETRDRRDLEQELAISGRSSEGSPSMTPARSQHDKRDEDWWMAAADQRVRAEDPRKMTRQHSLHL